LSIHYICFKELKLRFFILPEGYVHNISNLIALGKRYAAIFYVNLEIMDKRYCGICLLSKSGTQNSGIYEQQLLVKSKLFL